MNGKKITQIVTKWTALLTLNPLLLYGQAEVSIRNISAQLTAFEVGSWVEVKITGATPNGAVSVIQNGASPYYFGNTDASGNWSVVAQEGPAEVGPYVQYWFVNGIQVTPKNPPARFIYAPRLPGFTVYANFGGTNGPPPSDPISALENCGRANSGIRWLWTPITYDSTSAIGTLASAAYSWEIKQNIDIVPFSGIFTTRRDIRFSDDPTIPNAVAVTRTVGQGCSVCLNYLNVCTWACNSVAGVHYVEISFNLPAIAADENDMQLPANSLRLVTATHEIGHALRLGHPAPQSGRCSAVQSVMFPSVSALYACGIVSAQTVDGNAANGLYSSTPPYCPADVVNYCDTGVPCN